MPDDSTFQESVVSTKEFAPDPPKDGCSTAPSTDTAPESHKDSVSKAQEDLELDLLRVLFPDYNEKPEEVQQKLRDKVRAGWEMQRQKDVSLRQLLESLSSDTQEEREQHPLPPAHPTTDLDKHEGSK